MRTWRKILTKVQARERAANRRHRKHIYGKQFVPQLMEQKQPTLDGTIADVAVDDNTNVISCPLCKKELTENDYRNNSKLLTLNKKRYRVHIRCPAQ